MNAVDVESLNARAERLNGGHTVDWELVHVGFQTNSGNGPWCRLLRNGKPCHKFSWRGEEIALWITQREKDAL